MARKNTLRGRKRCIEPGCKKFAQNGEKRCNIHIGPAIDNIVKVTEAEVFQFRALDAEMRNHLQAISITDQKITEAELRARETVAKLQTEKKVFVNLFETAQIAYNNFIRELSDKYDVDPKQMAIHPETRVIEDLRKQVNSS